METMWVDEDLLGGGLMIDLEAILAIHHSQSNGSMWL